MLIQSSLPGPTTLDDQLVRFLFNFSETRVSPFLSEFSGTPVLQDISLNPIAGRLPGYLISIKGSIEGIPFGGNFMLMLQGARVTSLGVVAQEGIFDQHKVEFDTLLESLSLRSPPTPGTVDTGADLEELLDAIGEWVTLKRGLPAPSLLERRLETREEFIARSEMLDLETQLATGRLKDLCVVLDLCVESDDLTKLFEDLIGLAVLGFYEVDQKSLTLVIDDGEISPLAWLTYAHEYTHASQDNQFDLARVMALGEDSFEAGKALLALTEGDARLVEYLFYDSLPAEQQAILAELLRTASQEFSNSPAAQRVPRIIRQTFGWEYSAGRDFLFRLYLEGGFEAVDAVYENPPQSTEQVIHLEKYLRGEAPHIVELPDLSSVLGGAWQLRDSGVMGELLTRVYLGTFVATGEALAAAAGWGGDRYALWKDDQGRRLMVTLFSWDTAQDGIEFFQAYSDFARAKGGGDWEPAQIGENARLWEADELALYLAGHDGSTLVVIGPDRATVELVLREIPGFAAE